LLQKPLTELTAATEHVAVGDFSSRVEIPQRDELGELGDCFNNMSFQMGNLIQTVNISIADIHKGMEQLAASLQVADRANATFLRNLSSYKEDSESYLNDLAQADSLVEQLAYSGQQSKALTQQNSALTGTALGAAAKGTALLNEATTALDDCCRHLSESQQAQLSFLEKGESWSTNLAGLAALSEHLALFVVEVALEAARSGHKDLTAAAESLSQSLQNTCTCVKELQQELASLLEAGNTAREVLATSLFQLIPLQEKLTLSAAT
jgi:methyl-accepting chemotaxis protein